MPEQLTKHPELTVQVLRSSGAKCGQGAAQEILSQCPADRFCKLPGGELCVYGLPEAARMTQITAAEWQALALAPTAGAGFGGEAWFGGAIGLLAGAAIGLAVARRRRQH